MLGSREGTKGSQSVGRVARNAVGEQRRRKASRLRSVSIVLRRHPAMTPGGLTLTNSSQPLRLSRWHSESQIMSLPSPTAHVPEADKTRRPATARTIHNPCACRQCSTSSLAGNSAISVMASMAGVRIRWTRRHSSIIEASDGIGETSRANPSVEG